MPRKLMFDAKPFRQNMVPPIPNMPMKAIARGSKRWSNFPTIGDMATARTPSGAIAKPAQLAV